MRSKALWALFITIVILALGVIVLAATVADVDAAEPDPQCWHGCPPIRTAQIWMPVVQQCSGQYCGIYTAEPEPGR